MYSVFSTGLCFSLFCLALGFQSSSFKTVKSSSFFHPKPVAANTAFGGFMMGKDKPSASASLNFLAKQEPALKITPSFGSFGTPSLLPKSQSSSTSGSFGFSGSASASLSSLGKQEPAPKITSSFSSFGTPSLKSVQTKGGFLPKSQSSSTFGFSGPGAAVGGFNPGAQKGSSFNFQNADKSSQMGFLSSNVKMTTRKPQEAKHVNIEADSTPFDDKVKSELGSVKPMKLASDNVSHTRNVIDEMPKGKNSSELEAVKPKSIATLHVHKSIDKGGIPKVTKLNDLEMTLGELNHIVTPASAGLTPVPPPKASTTTSTTKTTTTLMTTSTTSVPTSTETLTSAPSTTPERDPRCPKAYTLSGKFCFKIFPNYQMSHTNVKRKCALEGKGGRLPILDTKEKFETLRAAMQEVEGERTFWVGITGNWMGYMRWDDGSEINKNFWAPDEPSSRTEQCGDMRTKLKYMLNDVPCSGYNFFPVCEIPL